MQLQFETYLSAVESYLQPLPANIRRGEVDEMASHLQQLHADFLAAGHTDEAAQQMALARFGSARKAGLRLRDVWEGNKGALWCFFAVALSNYGLQVADAIMGWWLFMTIALRQPVLKEALTPPFVAWMWWSLLLMPFGLNFLLGRWGGRRVLLSVPLAYLPLLAWLWKFKSSSSAIAFTIVGIKLTVPYVVLMFVIVATFGAAMGSFWQRRQRWVLVGGASLESASTLLRERQKQQRRGFWLRTSTCALVLIIIGSAAFAFVKARVDNVLHPPTPEAAVRVMLKDSGMNSGDMSPATDISTRLLAATPEELKKGQRRISYTATMHATESYRQKRIEFLQKNLRRALAGDQNAYDAKSCRLSLARLKPEGYRISRVVRVEKTSQGWKVQDGAKSDAYAWLYDMYYER